MLIPKVIPDSIDLQKKEIELPKEALILYRITADCNQVLHVKFDEGLGVLFVFGYCDSEPFMCCVADWRLQELFVAAQSNQVKRILSISQNIELDNVEFVALCLLNQEYREQHLPENFASDPKDKLYFDELLNSLRKTFFPSLIKATK